jgi:MFS family permease
MTSAAEQDLSERERILSLAAVISTAFGVGIAFGVGFPLTSLTLESWHQPKWMVGLAGAVPAIAILLALPLLPKVISRVGAALAIAGGCIIGSLGFLALYAFPYPWAWIAIRLAMSAGLALPWLAGETWINAIAREEIRGRVIAVYAIAFFSGFAVGPLLLRTLGTSGFAPFAAAAAITSLSALPIIIGRHLAPIMYSDGTRGFASAIRLAPAAMIPGFMSGFGEITNLSLIPNVALAAGWSQDASLALLTVMTSGGILLQYPIGWLSDKIPRTNLVIYAGLAFLAFNLLLPLALGNPVAALVLMFLIGGVILGFYGLGLAIIGERVRPDGLAAANAAFIVFYQIGALLGPMISGLAMTKSPVHGFVWTVAGLTIVSGICAVLSYRWERRQESRQYPRITPDFGA